MEIQQKENETLAAYIHNFKMEATRYDFNNYTAAIYIFVQGLRDAHNVAEKVYEKDPKTLSEVIKLVEKLDTAQVTATLSPPMENMMYNDENCFVCSMKDNIGHNCPQAQYYNCDDFGILTKTTQRKLLHLGHPVILIDPTPTCMITTAAWTGQTLSITGIDNGTALTG